MDFIEKEIKNILPRAYDIPIESKKITSLTAVLPKLLMKTKLYLEKF
ncbi:MAG: hypothetical protein PHX44_02120 [Sulfurimonas sp.]|nr:hypothetical protein [Sulfurimonas sp.]MDD2651831.1 hypothetical protein [Sulfurimonas sp.]MDD3451617.1 hypothetical protein [Sulfurimonas sp.]